tara:strand:- start:1145 stop:1309 length:165 start_codon:yes stop_codon:yes gene_type:complete
LIKGRINDEKRAMKERREQQNSLAAEGSSGPIVKNDEEKQREDADHIAQKLFEQ